MQEPKSDEPRSRTWKRPLLASLIAGALFIAVGSGLVLARGNPFAKYPPAKAAILEREQNELATARAGSPAPKNPNYTPPASAPQPTPVAGIEDGVHEAPFPACEFLDNNFWQGPANGQWYLVYAGSASAHISTCDHSQGTLAIFSEQIGRYGDGPMTTVGWFTAPAGVRNLTITAVNGKVMTLRTNTGATLEFYLSTDRFSSGG